MSFSLPFRSKLARLLQGCIALLITLSQFGFGVSDGLAAPPKQGASPQTLAAALLETLTPEERVGQLFMVTFSGPAAPSESQIYDLIANYHIGGVVLRSDMDNFLSAPDTDQGLRDLVAGLQQAEVNTTQATRQDVISGETYNPNYIPLLVAISQEGDGYPTDQLLDGLSPLPSAMALGATWDPSLARRAGEMLGSELSSLGINMLLGPSLDVLDNPRPQGLGDLGVRSFGGDPFWVGQMGQAFVSGVHDGSENRIAVVTKRLPGNGGTDRPVEEEVPTVRKSLSQLTQIELPPFFAVTGEAPDVAATTDAMLLAHIRYQGFQGNIRTTTRPISLDAQAFAQLIALPQFSTWRANGGVIMSDSLGTRAIRRNYDPAEQTFNSSLVARDAFLAGNDLLYLGNFQASGDPDASTSIRSTVQFFAQKYREDQAFAERVDASVSRILALKFKLYPQFNPNNVIPSGETATSVGQNESLIFEVGRMAATLLSPSPEELAALLPDPPGRFEQIVFFTDSYTVQQCSQCPQQSTLPINAMQDAVLDLYGPQGTSQVTAANMTSFSFVQLARTLDNQWPEGQDPVSDNLQIAEWVVFAVMKQDARPESTALRRLLSERPDLIQNKKVIVFAMNAPYYLDATDITKISAYYGLYSKEQGMTQVAARLLFQELSAPGVSPVSVEGIGYDLIEAIAPDASQVIPLEVQLADLSAAATETPTSEQDTPEPTQIPTFQAGDLLTVQAGPVLDNNGHIVPDNTPVTFGISIATEGEPINRQINASTHQGIAEGSYSIEDEGTLVVIATSGEPPASSESLQFEVAGINPEGLALQATQTAQAQFIATASAAPPPTAEGGGEPQEELPPQAGFVEWILTTLISLMAASFAFQAGQNIGEMRWAVRWALTTLVGGLVVGSYLAFNLPGSKAILTLGGEWGVVLFAVVGAALGWATGLAWRQAIQSRPAKPRH